MNENENIVELVDDETGETIAFDHLATIEHEGDYFIVLAEVSEEDEECEVIIMQIAEDEDGNDCYVQVEDETVLNTVYDKFLQLVAEEEEGEEE